MIWSHQLMQRACFWTIYTILLWKAERIIECDFFSNLGDTEQSPRFVFFSWYDFRRPNMCSNTEKGFFFSISSRELLFSPFPHSTCKLAVKPHLASTTGFSNLLHGTYGLSYEQVRKWVLTFFSVHVVIKHFKLHINTPFVSNSLILAVGWCAWD